MNRFRKLDLTRGEVSVRIDRQLICQNQQTVQGSPQLVAHVGQKFALEPAGRSELLRFFFERLPGLFDFAVLAFDLSVLIDELCRFFLQFKIGLLQFELAALQLVGQRLGLFEQVLRK